MENSDNSKGKIDTTYGKKLTVTCVERRYKIVDSKASFIIVAKKEFDEDATEKMLHEDMELKTFLANYEIANVAFLSSDMENVKIQKKEFSEIGKPEKGEPEKGKSKIGKSKIGKPEKGKPEIGKSEIGKSEIGKSEIGKSEIGKSEIVKKEESESTKKRRDLIVTTLKRRELFDSLELPEEFLVKDYIDAIEKSGMKISNSAMPYDDLKWLAKVGKVKMVNKTDRGITTYRIIRKSGNDNIISQSENDQPDKCSDGNLLPSKKLIDQYVS